MSDNNTAKRHVHADLIIAWANGAEIEYYSKYSGGWERATTPQWGVFDKFRIKPTPKPDVSTTCFVIADVLGACVPWGYSPKTLHNLLLVFDGETGKLKDAQVIAQ